MTKTFIYGQEEMSVKMCKKGIAWILALMLVLSMAPSVFAAEGENGTSAARPYEVKNPSAIPIGENNAVYRNKTLSDLEQDKNGDITGELNQRSDPICE